MYTQESGPTFLPVRVGRAGGRMRNLLALSRIWRTLCVCTCV